MRLALHRPHDDRPVGGVKTFRALRWRTMVAFHKELRVSLTIADAITFRNKNRETRRPVGFPQGPYPRETHRRAGASSAHDLRFPDLRPASLTPIACRPSSKNFQPGHQRVTLKTKLSSFCRNFYLDSKNCCVACHDPRIDGLNGHSANFVIPLSLGGYEHGI